MRYVIGVDLGGTKIVTALVDLKGRVIKKIKRPTHAEKGKSSILKKIIESVEFVIANVNKKKILGIGIGSPGPLDWKKGVILKAPNLPGWKNVSLRQVIQRKFRLKTVVDNDANCMALAESLYGVKVKNLVCLTLGTGVGGGIVINNEIYHGILNAGEIGHMSIVTDGQKCRCGNYGCLEEYVSTRGIEREAKRIIGKKIDPIKLQGMAEKGNKKAINVYKKIGHYLGVGLVNVVNILDPEVIVIGGGISRAGDLLFKEARKVVRERALSKNTKIMRVKLGDNAGVIGAAALIIKEVR